MKTIRCHNCIGRGEVHKGADWSREYEIVNCRTCGGTGRLLPKPIRKTKKKLS